MYYMISRTNIYEFSTQYSAVTDALRNQARFLALTQKALQDQARNMTLARRPFETRFGYDTGSKALRDQARIMTLAQKPFETKLGFKPRLTFTHICIYIIALSNHKLSSIT